MAAKVASKSAKKSLYSLHPGFAREAAYLKNLHERTGRTLEQWVAITRKRGLGTVRERTAWLKEEHGLTTDYARWVAESVDGDASSAAYDPEALVAAMFAKKQPLLPIYDQLLRLGLALGADVIASPCSTIVPLFRKHVILQLKPTTLTRIDLGFALGDPKIAKPPARWIDTGGFAKKDRITHRVPITTLAEIDREVERWMKVAYERDA